MTMMMNLRASMHPVAFSCAYFEMYPVVDQDDFVVVTVAVAFENSSCRRLVNAMIWIIPISQCLVDTIDILNAIAWSDRFRVTLLAPY